MTEDRDEIYVPSGAWAAWWHPSKCFRTLLAVSERLRLMEDERVMRQRDVESIMERLTETNRQLDASRAETASLRGDLAERGSALAAAEAKVRQLTAELAEMRDLEHQLEEFQRQLSQVEDLKRRYQRRIDLLRAKIKELDDKARLDDELAIDMTAPRIRTIPATPKAPSAIPTQGQGPVYPTAPDSAPVSPKSPGAIVGSPTVRLHDPAAGAPNPGTRQTPIQGAPADPRQPAPDLDWLQDLDPTL